MAGVCEEVPLDFEVALKQSRILIVGKIKNDSQVLRNLISLGFKDVEVVSEEGFSKPDAENYEKNVKSNLKVQNVQFHTNQATDYGVNFFRRFNVIFSIAESTDVITYLKETCSVADVPLIEKETVQLSEKVVKEKFNTQSANMVMELMAVYQVLQDFERKQRAEVVISKTKEDDHDPVKELTEALQMNMQIIRSNSMALDKYTNLLAALPSQVERSLSNQRSMIELLRQISRSNDVASSVITPYLRQVLSLLREISDKHDRTNQILSGTVSYMSPNV